MSADDHGSVSTYVNHKCRCQPCRDALAESMRDYRTRRAARRIDVPGVGLVHPDAEHGTEDGYTNFSCRCFDCRRAHAATARRARAKA